jgi:anti-anti-sigma regulatory factor/HAMP domain-containing protein
MRITISQRVGAGLLIGIALLISLILWTGASVEQYRANTRALALETLPAADNVGILREAISTVSEETLHFLITGRNEDGAARSSASLDVLSTLSIMGEMQDEDTANSAEQRAALNKVAERARELITLTDSLVAARRRGDAVDLIAVTEQLDASHRQVEAETDSYAELLRQERFSTVAGAEQDPLQVTRVLALLTLLVMLSQYAAIHLLLLRPLVRLRNAAHAVAAGDRSQLLRDTANDEIGDLSRAFNTMIERVGAQEQSLQERAATLEQANEAQRNLLDTVRALDVPVIPVGEGVLALPLVGAVDAARAGQLTQRLLDTVHRERASTVLLDVTGLAGADDTTARYLLETAQQLRLLGARAIVTGIRAELAHTLATLDLDLQGVDVRATLREGIAEALAGVAPAISRR